MFDLKTLRGQLTWAYASSLIVAMIAFAIMALIVIDREQHEALDTELATVARAAATIPDERHGRLELDRADRAEFNSVLGAKANGAVFDRSGAVVGSSSASIPSGVQRAALDATSERLLTVTDGGERIRALVLPISGDHGAGGALAIWRDADALATLERRIALVFTLAIPLIVAVAILMGGAIARRGLASLGRIATVADEIEGHDLQRRLNLPERDDELGRLAATFDRMLDRLADAFARERRFTSDASHELRAPLSVIRAEADLALRQEREPGEYRRALSVIVSEADALEHLTRELLAAARADASAAALRGPVDLNDIARSVGIRLDVLARERGVSVAVAAGPENLVVDANRGALERAVVPIVHNAITHARSAVELRTSRDGDFDELAVTDDGPGFTPAGLERAFDRFWRDDADRARDGTGLGMAIARTIVAGAGGTIAIANRPGGGAAVRIRLPRAQPPEGASSS